MSYLYTAYRAHRTERSSIRASARHTGSRKLCTVIALERQIPGLGDDLIDRVVERLLTLEPETTAVLLTGSYAKGSAAVGSDLDLIAITPSPRVAYRAWFEESIGAIPLHVSVAATTAEAREAKATAPARWSFGFPATSAASYLYRVAAAQAHAGEDPSLHHPAASPELEDFVDFALKAKRAAYTGDELGLRWFAQGAAAIAPPLLIPINAERIVSDRRDALDAALTLAVAPAHYAADLPVCLGLRAAREDDVKTAVARLGSELLAFLRERAPEVDAQPEIARYLADGTLERHLGLIE